MKNKRYQIKNKRLNIKDQISWEPVGKVSRVILYPVKSLAGVQVPRDSIHDAYIHDTCINVLISMMMYW